MTVIFYSSQTWRQSQYSGTHCYPSSTAHHTLLRNVLIRVWSHQVSHRHFWLGEHEPMLLYKVIASCPHAAIRDNVSWARTFFYWLQEGKISWMTALKSQITNGLVSQQSCHLSATHVWEVTPCLECTESHLLGFKMHALYWSLLYTFAMVYTLIITVNTF